MKITRTLLRQARSALESKIDYYSQYNPSPLSVNQFVNFGKTANSSGSYQFLRQELPVRLANIMKEFRLLPERLQTSPSLVAVRDLYRQSFEELLEYEHEDRHGRFTDALITIRDRHTDVVMQTATAVMEMKGSSDIDANAEVNVQYFLDRFYMSRISIRMLINQHTLLFGPNNNTRHIGCIDPKCDIQRVVWDAYENARFLCEGYYMMSPAMELHTHASRDRQSEGTTTSDCKDNKALTVAYVPSHLYHMLFELFKNAMRAVVEHHENSSELPPLRVLLVEGREDLSIKLSDQGGGIPRSAMDSLFNYLYSTAPTVGGSADSLSPPLAGYGYGLPLSRLYARYFQGDLTLMSAEGYGTDALIYLKAMASEANELLPIYNKTTQRQYTTSHQTNDWSNQLHPSSTISRPFSMLSRGKPCPTRNEAWKNLSESSGSPGNPSIDLHRTAV